MIFYFQKCIQVLYCVHLLNLVNGWQIGTKANIQDLARKRDVIDYFMLSNIFSLLVAIAVLNIVSEDLANVTWT